MQNWQTPPNKAQIDQGLEKSKIVRMSQHCKWKDRIHLGERAWNLSVLEEEEKRSRGDCCEQTDKQKITTLKKKTTVSAPIKKPINQLDSPCIANALNYPESNLPNFWP
jgi:hypothetical protein